MNRAPHDEDASLDAYVDGLLGTAQRERFERRLEQDAELRAELQRQQSLDQHLRAAFEPPPPDRAFGAIQAEIRAEPQERTRAGRNVFTLRRFAFAATIVLVLGGGWLLKVWIEPKPMWNHYARHTLPEIYRHVAEVGFQPNWECPTDRVFARFIQDELGQPLLLPSEARPSGIAYGHSISKITLYMPANGPSELVLLFADRIDNDSKPTVPPSSGLKLFRREVGELVLYELTPLDEPQVLELFYRPDPSEDWLRGEQP